MKVYTHVVIDMSTLEELEVETFKYFGEVSYCKGGGGGASGDVSWPDYLQDAHAQLIDHDGADTPTSSIIDVLNTGLGANPYTGENSSDPSTEITAIHAGVTDFDTLVTLLSTGTGLDTLVSGILDTTRIDTAVDAFDDDLDARIDADVYPRFEAGMLNINAVISSAFVIGRANIEEGRNREVAKYSASLRLKAATDDALKVVALKLEYQKSLTHYVIEANRIAVVAHKEQDDKDLGIDVSEATWDLEIFQHAANMLAGISGGTGASTAKEPSQITSAIGAGISGAATGALVGSMMVEGSAGGPWGAAIGAGLGIGMSLLG